jgi:type IV pilus assembly protein PilN
MYTPEINFLKERTDRPAGAGSAGSMSPGMAQGIQNGASAMIVGTAIAAILVGSYFTLQFFTGNRLRELETQQAKVNTDLSQAQAELARLQGLQQELTTTQARTTALKSFFNQMQPWSAILQDIRNQVPADVWITEIAAAGKTVTVNGQSLSFDQINDFQLTLLQSPLVADVNLMNATFDPGNDKAGPSVTYSMEVSLADRPLEDLLGKLETSGSTGLVRKIEILRSLEDG